MNILIRTKMTIITMILKTKKVHEEQSPEHTDSVDNDKIQRIVPMIKGCQMRRRITMKTPKTKRQKTTDP